MDSFLTVLKTLLALAVMVSIVPLAVWAGTGSPARAWEALKRYGFAMGVMCVPVMLVAVVASFTG